MNTSTSEARCEGCACRATGLLRRNDPNTLLAHTDAIGTTHVSHAESCMVVTAYQGSSGVRDECRSPESDAGDRSGGRDASALPE